VRWGLTLDPSVSSAVFPRDLPGGANAEFANLAEAQCLRRAQRGALCGVLPVIAGRVGVDDSCSRNNLDFVALFGILADNDFLRWLLHGRESDGRSL
jgi:hypothetical protein